MFEKIGRFRGIAYAIFLLLLAAICFGVQLDAATEKRSAFARLVPPFFKSEALSPAADIALRAQRPEAALRISKNLVERQPVAAENLSRLAQAYALMENAPMAQNAILAAAGRGWRDPFSQVVILESAIISEDWDVVAQRLAAMHKLQFPREVTDPQLLRLAQSTDGRRQISELLLGDVRWREQFSRYALEVLPPQAYSEIYRTVLDEDPDFDCSLFGYIVTKLLRSGAGAEALNTWGEPCAARSTSPTDNVPFPAAGVRIDTAGFGWFYPRQGGLSRTLLQGQADGELNFKNSSRLDRVLAQRFLGLDQGAYKITLQVGSGAEGADIYPVMVCNSERSNLALKRSGDTVWTFTVPDASCSTQLLSLKARTGRGTVESATISQT